MKTDKTTTKQDKEIKDRKGSQPAKYYAKDAEGDDMAKSTKQARARHFEKGTKKDDDDPSAYKPAPGDKSAKTKPSKFTLKYKKMFGERRKQAVAGGKVQKLVTGFGLKYKGKTYKEIDMELKGVDNVSQMVTFNIVHPKEIFGNEIKLPFKTIRRGPFMATEAPRIPRKKGQPAGSDKHSDLYTDENPEGTIHGLGFKDVPTAKASVSKIEKSDRTHAHKIQAAIAMEQRAKEMGKKAEAAIYRAYIEKMKIKTKKMNEERKMSFTNFYKDKKMDEGAADKSLKKKAEASGMSFSILKKVYNRGVAAWRTGHRPGTTPEQWGHARVNSFVTKSSGTWGKADKDLADKVRASKKEELEEDNVATLKNIVKRKQAMPLKFKDGTMKVDFQTASGLVRSMLGGKIKPETMKKLSFVINKGNKLQFLRLVDLMYKK